MKNFRRMLIGIGFSVFIVNTNAAPQDKSIDPSFFKNGKLDPKISEFLEVRDSFFECGLLASSKEQTNCYLKVSNLITQNSIQVLRSDKATYEMYQSSILFKNLKMMRDQCDLVFPDKLKPYFLNQTLSCKLEVDLQNYKEILLFNRMATSQG